MYEDFTKEDIRRFSKLFNEGDKDDCWEWKGTLRSKEYASFKGHPAHRVSFVLYNVEEIPTHYVVCHKCDNRRCVNPNHLYVGSRRENGLDRWHNRWGFKPESFKEPIKIMPKFSRPVSRRKLRLVE